MNEYIIYVWTNDLNGMQYVGYTKNGVEFRFYYHLISPYYFGQALRFHGKENFSSEVLLRGLTVEEACKWEIHYIKELGTLWPDGYNLLPGGNGNHNKPGDYKLSEETRKAMLSVGPLSEEHRRKLSIAMTGFVRGPMSDEHKRNLSNSLKGIIPNEVTRKAMSIAHKGYSNGPLSEETKEKISNSLKGKICYRLISPEQVQAIRNSPEKSTREWSKELGLSYPTIRNVRVYKSFPNEP